MDQLLIKDASNVTTGSFPMSADSFVVGRIAISFSTIIPLVVNTQDLFEREVGGSSKIFKAVTAFGLTASGRVTIQFRSRAETSFASATYRLFFNPTRRRQNRRKRGTTIVEKANPSFATTFSTQNRFVLSIPLAARRPFFPIPLKTDLRRSRSIRRR